MDDIEAVRSAITASSQPLPYSLIEAAEHGEADDLLAAIDACSEPLPASIIIAVEKLRR